MARAESNLDDMTVQELTSLISTAEIKRNEKLEEARTALWEEMEKKAAAIGLTLDSLRTKPIHHSGERKKRKDAGAPVPVKFRGPNGEEWSGRGRPPTWLTVLEADGKSRDKYRI